MAYVDLDSIQIHYDYYKERTSEFEKKRDAVDRDLNSAYQKIENERISFLQKGNNISQIEAENFQRDYSRKMQSLEGQKRSLENQMQEEGIKTMEELKKKINDFLGDYNKSRGYSYIFSYSSGINVLFYKDTTYNITREVIDGLNEAHRKGKDKNKRFENEFLIFNSRFVSRVFCYSEVPELSTNHSNFMSENTFKPTLGLLMLQ